MSAFSLEGLPTWMIATWLGTFGLVLGSFLNVVVHRVPRGLSVVTPRSACPGCGRFLPWHENVPVLSWLALRGRCAGCGSRITARYAAVEVLVAALVVGAYLRFGLTLTCAIAVLFSALVVALVFIDAELMLLPDALTLPGAFAGLVLSFWSPLTNPRDALLGVVLAVFVLEGLNLSYRLVRGRDGFGAGDTKMLVLVAAFLGWQMAGLTLVLAAFAGALLGIPAVAASRWLRREPASAEEIPADEDPEAADAGPSADTTGPGEASPFSLRELLPSTAEAGLGPLTFLLLVVSLLPDGRPERALAGLLVGIVLAVAQRTLLGSRPRARATAWQWPLLGAVLGMPPGVLQVVGSLAALTLIASIWRAPPPPEQLEAVDDDPLEPGPSLMQSALPFGVFLGVGSVASLFFGDDLVSWYAGFFRLGPD